MSVYKIADIKVEFSPVYDRLKIPCRKYLCEDENCNYSILVKENFIKKETEKLDGITADRVEYVWYGTVFNENLLRFNAMMLHASAVLLDGNVYLFSAPCGTGKSTHANLWLDYFGKDKAVLINDDKPVIRRFGNTIKVYGTPFSGKTMDNENLSGILKGICFLSQAKENEIRQITAKEALLPFLSQTIKPEDSKKTDKLCELADYILTNVPIYEMGCNISENAVKLAYETMSRGVMHE